MEPRAPPRDLEPRPWRIIRVPEAIRHLCRPAVRLKSALKDERCGAWGVIDWAVKVRYPSILSAPAFFYLFIFGQSSSSTSRAELAWSTATRHISARQGWRSERGELFHNDIYWQHWLWELIGLLLFFFNQTQIAAVQFHNLSRAIP